MDGINIYDLHGLCYGAPSGGEENKVMADGDIGMSVVGGTIRAYKRGYSAADYTPWLFKNRNKMLGEKNLKDSPACTAGHAVSDYLNDATVRAQLHIPDIVNMWTVCADKLNYTSLPVGSQWVWEGLKGHYRMLKFSGDVDGAVPTKGTIRWIDSLNQTIVKDWRPFWVDDWFGGSIIDYEGLTLGTIHGAGHMTPIDKPAATYKLIFDWVFRRDI